MKTGANLVLSEQSVLGWNSVGKGNVVLHGLLESLVEQAKQIREKHFLY